MHVHAIALHCQVRIEPQRRGYDTEDEEGLRALFGDRDRWPETLKPFQWMQCHTTVQGFTGGTEVDLELPCTYDFDVMGSRFLHGVHGGKVPLNLMFSGTVFTRGEHGFGILQVPWDSEARYDLPVSLCRNAARPISAVRATFRTPKEKGLTLCEGKALIVPELEVTRNQAAMRRGVATFRSRFGAVMTWVAYSVRPVKARPPTRLPSTVGISFQIK